MPAPETASGVALAALLASAAVLAAASSAAGCRSLPEYQVLDFWLGEWTVHVAEQQVGRNRIDKVLDGCALEEHWQSAAGAQGQSLFYYVPALAEWRQVWVTANATAPGGVKEKRLIERRADGSLVFQGEVATSEGRRYLDRTTLAPLGAGRVRQLIEASTDGGATWRTAFDAEYRRVPGATR
ncbi:MAG: hypothetical protein R3E86_10485 [Pseudomonadales bacterium]